jgi:hypothetical protein
MLAGYSSMSAVRFMFRAKPDAPNVSSVLNLTISSGDAGFLGASPLSLRAVGGSF